MKKVLLVVMIMAAFITAIIYWDAQRNDPRDESGNHYRNGETVIIGKEFQLFHAYRIFAPYNENGYWVIDYLNQSNPPQNFTTVNGYHRYGSSLELDNIINVSVGEKELFVFEKMIFQKNSAFEAGWFKNYYTLYLRNNTAIQGSMVEYPVSKFGTNMVNITIIR